jgi:hypothetical protein
MWQEEGGNACVGREFLTGQKLIPFKLAEHHQFVNREVAVENFIF